MRASRSVARPRRQAARPDGPGVRRLKTRVHAGPIERPAVTALIPTKQAAGEAGAEPEPTVSIEAPGRPLRAKPWEESASTAPARAGETGAPVDYTKECTTG